MRPERLLVFRVDLADQLQRPGEGQRDQERHHRIGDGRQLQPGSDRLVEGLQHPPQHDQEGDQRIDPHQLGGAIVGHIDEPPVAPVRREHAVRQAAHHRNEGGTAQHRGKNRQKPGREQVQRPHDLEDQEGGQHRPGRPQDGDHRSRHGLVEPRRLAGKAVALRECKGETSNGYDQQDREQQGTEHREGGLGVEPGPSPLHRIRADLHRGLEIMRDRPEYLRPQAWRQDAVRTLEQAPGKQVPTHVGDLLVDLFGLHDQGSADPGGLLHLGQGCLALLALAGRVGALGG